MAEKVTHMILKVDLQCPSCYKKVKKTLCKFPQIRDQLYDEKNNLVKITVVCCSPEKIRDKLCCKGGKAIKSIEILEPPKPKSEKPKEPEKPKPAPEKPKEPEKPKPAPEKPKEPEKPKPAPEKPKEPEKPKPGPEKPKEPEKPKPAPEKPKETEKPKPPAPEPAPPKAPEPIPAAGYPPVYPVAACQCFHGYGGGPCYHHFGAPPPPPPCYDYNYYRGCPVSRCEYYFTEENPQACSIM